ncbi:OpgC domain-containing protein [Kiloniella laminariae]|uniref:OpgC domain-containing protein n=1 Tax=Kiloniella laminariae TaxID=454162 RepID=A0ABT4LNS6_9PROT|nr:OpgC domain-containing protein [Kiloniella laminariae]MCZ4282734.1 OpgC domain-containing protein [Kiloniella laminariae]
MSQEISDKIRPELLGVLPSGKRERDPRLDFFRGLAMLFIFIAHIPENYWSRFIPGRFGPSDATEMFVFCSGFAAAIAFGGTFRRSGFGTGTARIIIRCVQIFFAHLGLFFAVAAVSAYGDAEIFGGDYINKMNLGFFFDHTGEALIGLFTLTYVPNYFDIMPMYIGVLAMVPIVMFLARFNPWLAAAFSLGLYIATWIWDLGFSAEPFSDREWFFNPLAWQVLFFSGFAISSGWVKTPKPNKVLLTVCVVFILVLVPFSNWSIIYGFPDLISSNPDFSMDKIRLEHLRVGYAKTNFGLLRWAQFFALAYICASMLKGREHILKSRYLRPIIVTGQQALPVFILSMTLSWIGGMVLDLVGRDAVGLPLVNISGLIILIVFAYAMSWIKAAPWTKKTAPVAVDNSQETVSTSSRVEKTLAAH